MKEETPVATPERRVLSSGDIATLRTRVEQRRLEAPVEPRIEDWRFHDAAAVLAWFELNHTLQPVGRDVAADAAAIERLVSDSISTPSDSGRTRWALKNGVRKTVLSRLRTREAIKACLDANPHRPDDVLQRVFEQCIAGTLAWSTMQSLPELSAVLQALDWLPDEILAADARLPSATDVRTRIAQASLRAPFVHLAGADFRGRARHLSLLREYVEVLDSGSIFASVVRTYRQIRSLKEKPPLMIHGPGGMGKSTLLAKFILDHTSPSGPRLPFIYLDCDRPGLVPSEPLTLLFEAVRQLAVQFPTYSAAATQLLEFYERKFTATAADQVPGPQVGPLPRGDFLASFKALVTDLDLGQSTLLLVIDTFEEVQVRGQPYVLEVWKLLEELQQQIPSLRTVVAGRARVAGVAAEHLPLEELDQEAAVSLLQARGISDEKLAAIVAKQMRGNPLSLKLAAQVLRAEEADSEGVADLKTSKGLSRLDDTLVQGQLYRRILSHIKTLDAQKLAHPGLILRAITPELIAEVLAGPCGVDVSKPGRARALFDELRKEVALVATSTTRNDEVRHRPDVRRVMLDLLRKDEPAKVAAIQVAAVEYYYKRNGTDPEERAEELYHRLGLNQNARVITERWVDGVEMHLLGAVEELTGSAQRFLARRLGIDLEAVDLRDLPLAEWEQAVVKRADDLLRVNRASDALDLVRTRSERNRGSPLFALEAKALDQLGRLREARSAGRAAIAAGTGDPQSTLGCYVIVARADETLGDPVDESVVHAHFRALVSLYPGDPRVAQVGLSWYRSLARSPRGGGVLVAFGEMVEAAVRTLSDAQIAALPELYTVLAREVVSDTALLERIQRLTTQSRGDDVARRRRAEVGTMVVSELAPRQQKDLEALVLRHFPTMTELDLLVRHALATSLGDVVPASASMPIAVSAFVARAINSQRLGELLAAIRQMRPDAAIGDLLEWSGSDEHPESAPRSRGSRVATLFRPDPRLLGKQAPDLPSSAEPSPYSTFLVSGARPFIGRHVLRDFLARVHTTAASRILHVDGPRGSGKSYSIHLIEYLAAATGAFRYAVVPLDRSLRLDQLVNLLADVNGWNAEAIPRRRKEGTELRYVSEMMQWVVATASRDREVTLLVLDDAGEASPMVAAFIQQLAAAIDRASGTPLRLVLLGKFALPPRMLRVTTEQLALIGIDDVQQYVRDYIRQQGESEAVADEFVRALGDVAAALPETERAAAIYREASSVMRRFMGKLEF